MPSSYLQFMIRDCQPAIEVAEVPFNVSASLRMEISHPNADQLAGGSTCELRVNLVDDQKSTATSDQTKRHRKVLINTLEVELSTGS